MLYRLRVGFCGLLVACTICLVPSARAESANTSAVLPFVYCHHELLVSVRIAGSGPYTFLLDTDTTPSVIDVALARKLRLRFDGPSGQGSGIGSDKTTALALSIPKVSAGPVSLANLPALATDLSGLSSKFKSRIDGVLGTSFLNGLVVQIDYPCRTISFLPDAPLEAFTSRFTMDGENVSRDVWIGSTRVAATFDTGDAGFMFATKNGIARLHLETAAKNGRVRTAYGYNGAARSTQGSIAGLRIGTVLIGKAKTDFLPSDTSPYDVNLGNRIFERYITTFDYQRGLLTLSPAHACAH